MIHKTHIEKAYWVLQAFSPAELQAYTFIDTPTKHGRQRHDLITIDKKIIPSTGIPASTIHRFQTTEYRPRERSIRKLAAFYDRYQYYRFRAYGASQKDARKFARYTPERGQKVLYKYAKYARNIQNNYHKSGENIPIEFIQWGMAHSAHGYNDWDSISKISGVQRHRPPKKRRKGYGHHRE